MSRSALGTSEDRVAAFERRFAAAMVEEIARLAGYVDGPGGPAATRPEVARDEAAAAVAEALSWQEATRRFQRSLLEQTLIACEWSATKAARRLGLSRSGIYSLIQTFAVHQPADG